MAEYIEKEAAKGVVATIYTSLLGEKAKLTRIETANRCYREVSKIPAADVVPVRHGRWVAVKIDEDDEGVPTLVMAGCDQCHMVSWNATPFCGYCGAKMEEQGKYGGK